MELQVTNAGNVTVGEIFAIDFNEGLVHQVVTAYMAAGRQGSKAQKSRSAVSGGGIKPWRQKGTGRARAGTSRSPIWRSGGVTFAATPRDYSKKVNKKMYRKAMASIVSELIRLERVTVVEAFTLPETKTKAMVAELKALGLENDSVMVITEAQDDQLHLASRNLPFVDVYAVSQIDPVSLIGFERVVITVGALKALEEKLA